MPKFYISDGDNKVVLDAQSPLSACVKALRYKYIKDIPIDNKGKITGHYLVSERGFENEDSYLLPIQEVVNVLFEY